MYISVYVCVCVHVRVSPDESSPLHTGNPNVYMQWTYCHPARLHGGKERVATANISPTVHVWCPVTLTTSHETHLKAVIYESTNDRIIHTYINEGDVVGLL